MSMPLQISFRDMEPSAAIEARMRERVTRFHRYYDCQTFSCA